MLAWHVVNSKPAQEARAAIELANQGFHVFLPVMQNKPLFPRYLFVEFDREIDNWGTIKNTRGCVDLLRNGFQPATVPSKIMEAIMAYKAPESEPDAETEFAQGQRVAIVTGPLTGLEGLFVANRHNRVYALLEILGKRVEVSMDSIRVA